jgi:hypothetical protein
MTLVSDASTFASTQLAHVERPLEKAARLSMSLYVLFPS